MLLAQITSKVLWDSTYLMGYSLPGLPGVTQIRLRMDKD